MSSRIFVMLALAFAIAFTPRLAHAGDDRRARAHARQAKAFFDAGDYAHAIDEYQAAYALDHKPSRVYNLAVCHERQGDRAGALVLYRQYLELDPDGEAARVAAQAVASLSQAEATDAEAARAAAERTKAEAEATAAAERAEAEAAEREAAARAAAERAEALRANAERAHVLVPGPRDTTAAAPARTTPRWLWPTLAATAVVTGLVLDFAPSSSRNGRFDAIDVLPLGCYALGAVFVVKMTF